MRRHEKSSKLEAGGEVWAGDPAGSHGPICTASEKVRSMLDPFGFHATRGLVPNSLRSITPGPLSIGRKEAGATPQKPGKGPGVMDLRELGTRPLVA